MYEIHDGRGLPYPISVMHLKALLTLYLSMALQIFTNFMPDYLIHFLWLHKDSVQAFNSERCNLLEELAVTFDSAACKPGVNYG